MRILDRNLSVASIFTHLLMHQKKVLQKLQPLAYLFAFCLWKKNEFLRLFAVLANIM